MLVEFLLVVAVAALKLSVVAPTRVPLIVLPPTTTPPPPDSNETGTPLIVTAGAPGTNVWLPTTYSDPESKLAVKGCVPIVRIWDDGKNEGKDEGVVDGNEEVTPLTTIAEANGARE